MRWTLPIFLLLCGWPALGEESIPVYRAARTLDPIVIDGRLNEFTWAALPRVGRFTNIRDPAGPSAGTQAALAWDDRKLYIVFICSDEQPWSGMYERDSFLWRHEAVEVFLDPDGDGLHYPEIQVSPHNIAIDLLIPQPPNLNTDPSIAAKWDIQGFQTAVSKQAAGWIVEMAVPWSSLEAGGVSGMPRPGDRWRVGLYRIERPGGLERAKVSTPLYEKFDATRGEERQKVQDQLAEYEGEDQFLSWSPVRNGFHDPERFGIVEFVLRP